MDVVIDESFNIGKKNYYSVIAAIKNKSIVRSIDIDIDRGLLSFGDLPHVLALFPALKKLIIRQNYYCGDESIEDFMASVNLLSIDHIIIYDQQSEIFQNLPKDIFHKINKIIEIYTDGVDADEYNIIIKFFPDDV
jgi:hypothetical protein